MKVVSPSFAEERRRYGLRFTCEDCAHFEPSRASCGHGYPTAEHRRARYAGDAEVPIVFCKEWELV